MSAIAAFWSFDGARDAREGAARMGEALAMHGPDAAGTGGDREVALAWRGRTILPEDPFDAQPRPGPGSTLLAADCRIDNRGELRERLGVADGDAPMPDSAFVLAAYEAWGERCVDHLVGDFAFVVWDPRRRCLFAARDHLGVRPLYFHRGSGFFALASMPKGLFALGGVARTLNRAKLLDILLMLAEKGTDALYEQIERIPPGHSLLVREDGHRLTRYWSPEEVPALVLGSDEAYREAFEAHLREAVRCRLRSVSGPIAAQLSGGWDSTTITSLLAEELARDGRELVAITAAPRAGFDGPVPRGRFADEDRYAALVAARHDNVEHIVLREGRGLMDDLGTFARAAEVPVLNLCNQKWILALGRKAKEQGARVLFGARGGNMTISHAGQYYHSSLFRSGRWWALAREIAAGHRSGKRSWKNGLRRAVSPFVLRGIAGLGLFRERGYRKRVAYIPVNRTRISRAEIEQRALVCGWSLVEAPWPDARAMRVAGLTRMDEAPFLSGLEAIFGMQMVDPTIDKRLVEFCLGIPENQYFREGEDRPLLRRAMAGRLPAELLEETRKGYQGADWYEDVQAAAGEIAEELERCGRSPLAAELLDIGALQETLRALPSGGWDRGDVVVRYRYMLLRGLSLGSFIRRVEGETP